MSDVNTNIPFDPFAEENLAGGGGLWDGKTVTILEAKTEVEPIRRKVGEGQYEQVIDERTGRPAFRNVLTIVGVADDEDRERRESYSAGATYTPTPDGEGFVIPEGKRGFSQKSEIAKFGKYIREGGFDTTKLIVNGQQKFSALRGARLVFKGEATLDKAGKIKKNSKGYEQQKFWPKQFVGFKTGMAKSGNGAVTDEAKAKFDAAVVDVLKNNGGKLVQHELVRNVPTEVAQYILRNANGSGWNKQGFTYSLAE